MSSENPVNDDLCQSALNDLHSSDYKRWRQALEILVKSQYPLLVPALIRVLREMVSDKDWSQRLAAAKTLGNMGVTEAVPALIDALNSNDEWVATAAAEALGKLKDERAIPALVNALRSEKALRLLSDAVANHQDHIARKDFPPNADPSYLYRPELLQFNQDIYDVRAAAAKALSDIGSDQALVGLATALYFRDDHSSAIRTVATKLLSESGTQKALDLLREWQMQ